MSSKFCGFSTIRYIYIFCTIFITKVEKKEEEKKTKCKRGLMCQVDLHAWGYRWVGMWCMWMDGWMRMQVCLLGKCGCVEGMAIGRAAGMRA